MRPPRARFTIRLLMTVVAVAAVLTAMGRSAWPGLKGRWNACEQLAARTDQMARRYARLASVYASQPVTPSDHLTRRKAAVCKEMEREYLALGRKYRLAFFIPWEDVKPSLYGPPAVHLRARIKY